MGSEQYEFDYIYNNTGRYPAIRGLDYMNDDFSGVNRRAKEWHDRGGIVTICWHCGFDFTGSWDECMKTVRNDWDLALTEGTPEYESLIAGMDKAAKALKELKDQNIPVLWRPFHEFDGQWFWWGKGGSENFKRLWKLMYDKFKNEYKLDNLIWVLGYADFVKDGWYPGDEYCDIIGSDTYDNSTHKAGWELLKKLTGKPMAFHECGNVPPVGDFVRDGAVWAWFMTWHTQYLMANNNDTLSGVYNDPRVITLDKLPAGLVN